MRAALAAVLSASLFLVLVNCGDDDGGGAVTPDGGPPIPDGAPPIDTGTTPIDAGADTGSVLANDVPLDPSFGQNGMVSFAEGLDNQDEPVAIARQSDG